MKIRRPVLDSAGRGYVLEADTSDWAVLRDGIAAGLRELDAAALVVARLCPDCRVDLGELHDPGCPLASSDGASA